MARIWVVVMLVFAFVVVLPTCCNAARAFRDRTSGLEFDEPPLWNLRTPGLNLEEIRSLSEEKQESEKRSLNWKDQESGDDAVPSSSSSLADNYAAKYNNWVRFQEEQVTQDYGDTPAAANPSVPSGVPCC